MGACLSCLGLTRLSSNDAERQRLLYDNHDPYSHSHSHPNGVNGAGGSYGSWNAAHNSIPAQNLMSAEEVRREQQALNNITRWASDQIVEIFPHRATGIADVHINGHSGRHGNGNGHGGGNGHGNGNGSGNGSDNGNGMSASAHQDILLSMIPGDKNKRSIRIYPASRPGSSLSRDGTASIRSKGSATRLNGSSTSEGQGRGVFVKLDVDL